MPSREQTDSLVILLGAHEFPHSTLRPAEAFRSASLRVKEYFLSPDGFGICPADNLLDLFDSEQNAIAIYKLIANWLRERLLAAASAGNGIGNLFLHYVGHGGLAVGNNSYYLAIQATEDYDRYTHSLSLYALAAILRTHTRELRRFIFIDACFAANACDNFQGEVDEVIGAQLKQQAWAEAQPHGGKDFGELSAVRNSPGATRGTALLCASSRTDPAKFGANCTYFSEALAKVLQEGTGTLPAPNKTPIRLSLRQVKNLMSYYITDNVPSLDRVLPEVHSPKQDGGSDIADDEIFPNPAAHVSVAELPPVEVVGVLRGHENHVDCVAWSSDGLRLASGSYDNCVRIWECETQRCESTFKGHSRGVSDIAWNRGKELRIASASYDQTVRLWEPGIGQVGQFNGHQKQVRCLTWTNSDRLIASGDEAGCIQFWSIAKRASHRKIAKRGVWCNALSFNSGNGLLAIGLSDGNILLRNPLSPDYEKSIKAHHGYVNALAWVPDSNLLCSGSGSGTIRLWNVEKGENALNLKSHLDKIYRLSFSADGTLMASIGQDRLIIWSTQDWRAIHIVDGPFPSKTYLPLAFAPSGTLLASACADDLTSIQVLRINP